MYLHSFAVLLRCLRFCLFFVKQELSKKIKGASNEAPFLYLNIKSVLTARAHNGVLSLFPRQAKIVSAGGTFFVNVGRAVALFTFLKVDKLLRFICQFYKFFVFLLSFVNIS